MNNWWCPAILRDVVFNVQAKNERFTSPGSRCRQNLKYEKSRRDLVDYVKELH